MSLPFKTIPHVLSGVPVHQREMDGYVNATQLCKAHREKTGERKDPGNWLDTNSAKSALAKLSDITGIPVINLSEQKTGRYGGTWIHPRLAVRFAMWLNDDFSLQVEDWVHSWVKSGFTPAQIDAEAEWILWKQRYDIRIYLKDFLRVELMNLVVRYANQNSLNARTLCSDVHDRMNERIQGLKSKQIKAMGGMSTNELLRDHLEAPPLVDYSAINRLAKNAIEDRNLHPVDAVDEACDFYLGRQYQPKPLPLVENVYTQGQRIKAARHQERLNKGIQLSVFGADVAS